ncbi:MAG: chorismate synthase [Thermoleophilia bacterium]|nr:chorismate synthase [Thermoleophilia bacterium]
MSTAGESHGPAELCILEGIPAGLCIETADIDADLSRRRQGYGRGGRMAIESDRCRIVAGVRHGVSLGSPIGLLVDNLDHANWSDRMSPDVPTDPQGSTVSAVTLPRPGHADLAGVGKYGHHDIRNVLERASARETVGRVAGGAVCRRLLNEVGVEVRSRVVNIGEVTARSNNDFSDPDAVDWQAAEASPVRCEDDAASTGMCLAIDEAREAGESLGGVFEVWCWGVCPGLGSYVAMESRLDGRLVGALASIPAIKGVEVGTGFENAVRRGSQVHDRLVTVGDGERRRIGRVSNRAGGLEGGMTTGMPIVLRAAMKPIPTLTSPLPSVDLETLQPSLAHVERSDVTAVPAASVVGEAMVAYVLAQAYLEKFSSDSMAELKAAVTHYETGLEERGLWRRS